jgi:hypothetical protein
MKLLTRVNSLAQAHLRLHNTTRTTHVFKTGQPVFRMLDTITKRNFGTAKHDKVPNQNDTPRHTSDYLRLLQDTPKILSDHEIMVILNGLITSTSLPSPTVS